MHNLIQSYFYKIRKMKLYLWSLPVSFLLVILFLYGNHSFDERITASEMIPAAAPILIMSFAYAPLCVVPSIFGTDFMDKTVCLDVMAGHSRADIYVSRLWVAFVASMPYPVLTILLPVGFSNLFLEYGNSCDARQLWIRFGLLLLTGIRILMEMLVMIAIARNALAGSAFFISALLAGLFGGMGLHLIYPNYEVINGIFFCRALLELGEFNSWMGFADGRDIMYFDAGLPKNFVMSLIISNLVLIVVFFVVGLIHAIRSDY